MEGGFEMSDYCVVVTGGVHARFFTLEPVEFPELESGPRLVDQGEILNPEKGMLERDLYTDAKPGRGRSPQGGRAHGYDDHRSGHEDESERRFVRRILERTRQLAKESKARVIVLAAPARMLGLLRQEFDIIGKHGMEVHELAKDMTKFSPAEIHDHLAKEQLLPSRERPRG
jgi:protein required for attachment to host cells